MICAECAQVADTAPSVDLNDPAERRWLEACHRELCEGPGCTCQHTVTAPTSATPRS